MIIVTGCRTIRTFTPLGHLKNNLSIQQVTERCISGINLNMLIKRDTNTVDVDYLKYKYSKSVDIALWSFMGAFAR